MEVRGDGGHNGSVAQRRIGASAQRRNGREEQDTIKNLTEC